MTSRRSLRSETCSTWRSVGSIEKCWGPMGCSERERQRVSDLILLLFDWKSVDFEQSVENRWSSNISRIL